MIRSWLLGSKRSSSARALITRELAVVVGLWLAPCVEVVSLACARWKSEVQSLELPRVALHLNWAAGWNSEVHPGTRDGSDRPARGTDLPLLQLLLV